jgi:hypothetical protein
MLFLFLPKTEKETFLFFIFRKLTVADFDSITPKIEDVLHNIATIKEKYDLQILRSWLFGPCYTLTPK